MLKASGISAVTLFAAAIAIAFSPAAAASAPETGTERVSEVAAKMYGSAADPELVSSGETAIELAPDSGSSGQKLTLTLPESDYSLGGNAINANPDTDSHATTFVDESAAGVTVYTSSLNDKAATEFRYELGGVSDPYLVSLDDGSYVVLDSQDQYVANLGKPWAIDNAGDPVTTSFELSSGILTQHLDYTDSTDFPVIADPQITYQVDKASYLLVTGKEKATPARVMAELRRCFNCSFPVGNAPRAFPSLNQVIYLNASPMSFIKISAPVTVTSINTAGFGFTARSGHFDGAGSKVTFRFYNDASGWMHLNVVALVMNGSGVGTNAVNKTVASETWSAFHANLIRRTSL